MISSTIQNKFTGCAFCKRNKEPEAVYRTHQIRDREGRVTCPQLFKYRCELCGSTGQEAHTRSYCPLVTSMRPMVRQQQQQQAPSSARFNTSNNNTLQLADSSSSSSTVNSNDDLMSATNQNCSIQINRRGMFRNMGRVSNSRYNSAGRIRNNPNQFNQSYQYSSSTNYLNNYRNYNNNNNNNDILYNRAANNNTNYEYRFNNNNSNYQNQLNNSQLSYQPFASHSTINSSSSGEQQYSHEGQDFFDRDFQINSI